MARANLKRAAKVRGQLTFPVSQLQVCKFKMWTNYVGIISDSLAFGFYAYEKQFTGEEI